MINQNKYGIIIQARLSSSRLPGKVLRGIAGKPMLQRQIERLKNNLTIPVIVATSCENSDDKIANLCNQIGIECYRGPLDNVVLRFLNCAKKYKFTHIIRVGGDDPLIDPFCCSELIDLNEIGNYDFLYASHDFGWPYGCAAELIAVNTLEKILNSTQDSFDLEHTIPFILNNPNYFNIYKVTGPKNYQNQNLSLSVDYLQDFLLIERIYKELLVEEKFFSMQDIINLFSNKPELRDINRGLHNGFER
tara:strand:- start:3452 stop:4195 length:744 start_codon:yes stop_codon:yes gene_type:complete